MESFTAGVDCHKDTHTIVILDANGKVIRGLVIPVSASGYAEAIKMTERLGGNVMLRPGGNRPLRARLGTCPDRQPY